MAEAIAPSALRLFDALDLRSVVENIALVAKRRENFWSSDEPIIRAERLVHVDRIQLANAMIEVAIKRGARVISCGRLPTLRAGGRRVIVEMGAERWECQAAVDATGRSAVWSRPIERIRHLVAEIFSGAPMSSSAHLKLARLSVGWAYRIGLSNYTTIGVLSPRHSRSRKLADSVRSGLDISEGRFRYVGSRSAFVQWSRRPVGAMTLAVGDAAFAHDPIGGQGIRFALGSALAASSVIRTWRDSPGDVALASTFYQEFVATERARHLSFLRDLYCDRLNSMPAAMDSLPSSYTYSRSRDTAYDVAENQLPEKVCLTAPFTLGALHIDGTIKRGEVLKLPEGTPLRWLGGFDLLKLRNLLSVPRSVADLVNSLSREGLSRNESLSLNRWCLRRAVMRASSD
jgi:flavin-dependent dehydrogenase